MRRSCMTKWCVCVCDNVECDRVVCVCVRVCTCVTRSCDRVVCVCVCNNAVCHNAGVMLIEGR